MASRRQFSGQQKVQILRRHLLEHVPVSDLCDEYDLSPNVFYRWQKQFFQQGAAAFENGKGKLEKNLKKKVARLEEKIAHKDEVIAEIMQSHVDLKKTLGDL